MHHSSKGESLGKRVVLFEGHFLRWPGQIFVLHLKTDDLLQFLFLSQACDINPSEEDKKEKAPLRGIL